MSQAAPDGQPPLDSRAPFLSPNDRRRPSRALQAMRAGSAVARMLPAPVGRGLAEGIGAITARLPVTPGPLAAMGRRRQLAARHLRRVYGPDLSERDLDRRVAATFASYARYWEESLRLASLSPSEIRAGVRYEGLEHVQASEAAGRGTILALPHLGGWEWGGAGLVVQGQAMSVVVEMLHPLDVFDWFVSFRERLGMHVIPTGPGAAVACRRALAANHVLCLLSDRLVGGAAGVEVEFFGERTLLPAGPVTLAMRTGAALLPCAVYYEPGPSRRLGFIRPPLPLPRGGRLRDDVRRGTQLLALELEALIRREPTQWHLMQPNWPSDPGWPTDPVGSPHPGNGPK